MRFECARQSTTNASASRAVAACSKPRSVAISVAMAAARLNKRANAARLLVIRSGFSIRSAQGWSSSAPGWACNRGHVRAGHSRSAAGRHGGGKTIARRRLQEPLYIAITIIPDQKIEPAMGKRDRFPEEKGCDLWISVKFPAAAISKRNLCRPPLIACLLCGAILENDALVTVVIAHNNAGML
jgi:hypothetical protein